MHDQNGAAMSGASVAWASSASSVASVTPTGLVTAVADGTANSHGHFRLRRRNRVSHRRDAGDYDEYADAEWPRGHPLQRDVGRYRGRRQLHLGDVQLDVNSAPDG